MGEARKEVEEGRRKKGNIGTKLMANGGGVHFSSLFSTPLQSLFPFFLKA